MVGHRSGCHGANAAELGLRIGKEKVPLYKSQARTAEDAGVGGRFRAGALIGGLAIYHHKCMEGG